jgi:ATP/ADP translocase
MVSKKIKRTEQHNPLSPPRKERKGKGKKKKRKVKLGSSFQSPAKSRLIVFI